MSETKVKNNRKQWFKWISILFVSLIGLVSGVLILVNALFWYRPTSPFSKRKEFKQAHLISESSSFYSYSVDTSYSAEVIYEGYEKSSTFNVIANADNAYKISVPYDVNKVEFKIKETSRFDKTTKTIVKTNLSTFDKVAYRSSQDSSKWFYAKGHISMGSKKFVYEPLLEIHVGNAVGKDSADMPALLKGLNKNQKFIRSVFTNKTLEEILKQDVDAKWNISNIKIEVGPKDYKDYQAYKTKKENVEGSIHKYFWDATVVHGPFGGLQKNVEKIEPNVINIAYSFSVTINNNGTKEVVKGFIIKSKVGNDPTLGVKFGALLSKDGASFAGIPINGKTWIKDLGLSASPAGDIDGIYTIVLTGKSDSINKAVIKIAAEIGGMN
ncbi:MAG: hypothetical protein KAG14_00095 [Mycoplasmataceae bacterium]|nr:hypothetical protein [Mycoplasmataceae bacterium]